MLISEKKSRLSAGLLRWAAGLGAMLCVACHPALALDGTKTDPDDPSPVEAFKSAAKALKAGDMASASRALEFAAGKGHALAQWKLARMYAEGEGVPQDDLKAFEYYQAIANAYADESPDAPQARVVSSAFVALGSYYLNGIPNSDIHPDPVRAADMFQYAASYFGDSDAQYNLGRLVLSGADGVPKNPLVAARWFHLSAKKGHHQAQALLGQLLFVGQDVPRQAARGLMYLTLARDAAKGQEDGWIIDLYEQAIAAADPEEIEMARTYLEQHLKSDAF
jgi:TPR repeat protein